MPRPFEQHIPYFPGEERQDLSTPETTIFNNSGIVNSIDLIHTYSSPTGNSKSRSNLFLKIKDFCLNEEEFDTFRQTLLQTLESTQPDNDSHIRILQDLYSRIDDAYLRSEYMGLNNTKPAIPEGEPNAIAELEPRIHLANDALQKTFPDEFGEAIPEILPTDIIVVADKDLLRFQKDDARYINHPFRRNAIDEYNKKIGSTEKLSYSDKEGQVMIQVVTSAEHMPILYPLSEMDMQHPQLLPSDREIALDFMMVSSLLHENFHRSSKPRNLGPVSEGDSMFDLAFGPEDSRLKEMERTSDPNAPYYKELIEKLKEYSLDNDPEIRIDGVRVQVWCNDENGIKRMMTDSGHDLNEALIESLTYATLPKFLEYVHEKYGNTPTVQKLVALKNNLAYSDGTYRHANLMGLIIPYLKKLGLHDPHSTLVAYSQGIIPELHADLIPNEKYMF